MAIKHLICALLPFVCNGKPKERLFMDKIKDTGSKTFFKQVFDKIRQSNPQGEEEKPLVAIFDMDGTLGSASLLSPVLAYQIRNLMFAFDSDDVDDVFGFALANQDCVPTLINFGMKKSILFKDVVSKIRTTLEKYPLGLNSPTPVLDSDKEEFGAYVSFWQRVAYDHMKDRKHCEYLATTIKHRVLYKMDLTARKTILEFVLNTDLKGKDYDSYQNDFLGTERIRVIRPAVYEEQKALIKALIEQNVTPYVISTTSKFYLKALIHAFQLEIEQDNVFGSATVAEENGVEDLVVVDEDVLRGNGHAANGPGKVDIIQARMKGKIPVFVAGDSMGDFEMLTHVLNEGGFALVQQGKPVDNRLIKLVENTNKDKMVKRAHIQNVDLEVVKWIRDMKGSSKQ